MVLLSLVFHAIVLSNKRYNYHAGRACAKAKAQ